jgi:hypothetical protein
MTPQAENALRSVARECRTALVAALKAAPKAEHAAITTELLDRYATKVTTLPPDTFAPKRWLVYYIRLIEKEKRG